MICLADAYRMIEISWFHLGLAAGFVVLAGVISAALKLGLLRALLIGMMRCYVQLLLLAFVLVYIFLWDYQPLNLVILFTMAFFAAIMATCRVRKVPVPLFWPAFIAVVFTGFTITFAVTAGIIGNGAWRNARYLIPLAGMVFGNGLNALAISLERLFSDLARRRGEIHVMVSLGASAWEAALPSVRASVMAGLIPTLNTMVAAGLVFIPGMMTGQILGGADSYAAAKYQIVIILMLAGGAALTTLIAVTWSYRRAFDDAGAPLPGVI